MKSLLIYTAVFLFFGYGFAQNDFENPDLPIAVRVNDLISKLTLEEKSKPIVIQCTSN